MEREERLQQLNNWLFHHKAKSVGDKVYEGMGIVTLIDKGKIDYEIRIQPISTGHNLGNGYGSIINIHF